jgi:hypothetical protein
MREAIAISHILPTLHLIVTVTRKSYDPTIEATRELSGAPILSLEYDEAEERIGEILEAKAAYNEIKREGALRGISDPELPEHTQDCERFMELLRITDFSRPWLDTIIILDDAGSAGILRRDDSPFNLWLNLCRDITCMFYLAIHGFGQVSPSIRQNCKIIVLARGLSHERLCIVHRQANVTCDYRAFIQAYDAMNRDPDAHYLIIDSETGELTIE